MQLKVMQFEICLFKKLKKIEIRVLKRAVFWGVGWGALSHAGMKAH
jgi:hypothetical protein